jgi:transmembrane protein EpsG
MLYANWYNNLRLMTVDEMAQWSREKGFSLPAKILADAGFGYEAMFAVIAFVVALGVMLLIHRHSSVAWVSVTAFLTSGLYFNSMNFMRQFIAALFVAFALKYVARKRFSRYAALVLLASAFHFSALLLLPFYFIFKLRFNSVVLAFMLAGTMAAYIFVTPAMNFITNYVYTGYDIFSNVEAASGLPPVYTIAFALFFALAYLLRKMLLVRNKHTDTLLFSMFFAVFFSFMGTSHGILARVALLFIVAPVLILSADVYAILRDLARLTFIDSVRGMRCAVAIMGIVLLLMNGVFYGYLLHPSVNYNGVVPYYTISEKHMVGGDVS